MIIINIQIQHLLKLNYASGFCLPSAENSNTTLVKVKYQPFIRQWGNNKFKYNTC